MKKYTLGFIFNQSLNKVLLIHKISPDWQNGKINGIGGKIEDGEDGLTCIVREIKEETGLATDKDKWLFIGNMESNEWTTDVFGFIYTGDLTDAKSTDKEIVEWFDIKDLPDNSISNLRWLIPLTMDKLINNEFHTFKIGYK